MLAVEIEPVVGEPVSTGLNVVDEDVASWCIWDSESNSVDTWPVEISLGLVVVVFVKPGEGFSPRGGTIGFKLRWANHAAGLSTTFTSLLGMIGKRSGEAGRDGGCGRAAAKEPSLDAETRCCVRRRSAGDCSLNSANCR